MPKRQERRGLSAIYILFISTLLVVVVVAFYFFRKRDVLAPFIERKEFARASCEVYLLNEIEKDDTQLVSLDLDGGEVNKIGPVYKSFEFAGLSINPDNGILYTNSAKEGDFYEFDAKKGTVSPVDTSNLNEINSLSFHPTDESLWGFSEERGLVKIDPVTTQAEFVFTTAKAIGSLGWSNDGTVLYASDDSTNLFVYDGVTSDFEKISDNLLEESVGFVALDNGQLLAGHTSEKAFVLYLYDPVSLEITNRLELDIDVDPQGIAWSKDCGNPFK